VLKDRPEWKIYLRYLLVAERRLVDELLGTESAERIVELKHRLDGVRYITDLMKIEALTREDINDESASRPRSGSGVPTGSDNGAGSGSERRTGFSGFRVGPPSS